MLPDIQIGDLVMDGQEPVFILGPCAIESEDFARQIVQCYAEKQEAETEAFIVKPVEGATAIRH